MNKDRFVVRDTNTGDYVYRGWDDWAAARALTAGTVFGVGNTFLEAEAEATYRMCRQRQGGEDR